MKPRSVLLALAAAVPACTSQPPPVPAPRSATTAAPANDVESLPGEVAGAESAAPHLTNGQGPTSTTTATVVILTPAPTTTAEPAPTEPVGDVEWMVRQTFPENPETAARIAWCESRFNPRAGFPSGPNLGVMQINWSAHAARVARMGYSHDDLANPIINLAVARAIYDESGWRPWTCR